MLGLDFLAPVVEIDEVAGEYVDGPDREARLARLPEREIHEIEQGFAQRRAVVVARGPVGAGEAEPGAGMPRLEEAGLALAHGEPGAGGVARLAEDVAVGREEPDAPVGDALPERAQL